LFSATLLKRGEERGRILRRGELRENPGRNSRGIPFFYFREGRRVIEKESAASHFIGRRGRGGGLIVGSFIGGANVLKGGIPITTQSL